MKTRFVSVDRDQPLLLPPDLREWIPKDDLVHFVIQAVVGMNPGTFKVNVKGSGSAQYPLHMMLVLVIYCYANGVFSSRQHDRAFKIEQAEGTDRNERTDGQSLPEELARRGKLKAKLEAARARIEARAKAKAHKEQAEYERKVKAREQRKGRVKSCEIKKPDPRPTPLQGRKTHYTT